MEIKRSRRIKMPFRDFIQICSVFIAQRSLRSYSSRFQNLENTEEPEIKLSTSIGSMKKQESSRKTSTSALLTTPKSLSVWITTNQKILKEVGIPDHLTCLLRNLYACKIRKQQLELDMEQQTGTK